MLAWQPFSLISLSVAVQTAWAAWDGECHKSNNKLGKYCAFQNFNAFNMTANAYCKRFDPGQVVAVGAGEETRMANVPDGIGGVQVFYGRLEAKKADHSKDDKMPTPSVFYNYQMCHDDMMGIYYNCLGYGGLVNTEHYTAYGVCIRH